MREQLLWYAVKYDGNYNRIKKAIKENENWSKIQYDGQFITIIDSNYPKVFQVLRYKPWVIFYEGNIELLSKSYIGVVGSRDMSEYAKRCCEQLNTWLDNQYGIVSGLAKGVDAYAHDLALQQNRNTIAVIGCGIDVCYPLENKNLYDKIKKCGLLISEYPRQSKPIAYHFPWRNRLIAAICEQLVVVEARMRSGTLITVNETLELGKEIHCFVHDYFHVQGEGCNSLIQQGCHMIASKEDIKEI